MKYFVVADVHGYYDLMIAELNKAGFDPTNPDHTLISLGDAFDRGDKPVEVIRYFNNLPRKILIRGNHEDLLGHIFKERVFYGHDYTNGTFGTVVQLASAAKFEATGLTFSEKQAQVLPQEAIDWAQKNVEYQQYRNQLVDYFETEHYVFVHGWIPCNMEVVLDGRKMKHKFSYMSNWRQSDEAEWDSARWTNGCACTEQEIFEPNKAIVCGHWHCSAWHTAFAGAYPMTVFTPYMSEEVIACDACTAFSGRVNVVILED